jgi:ribulose-5-phosphate 4-epimerase/fuculose-1-phosphate aldolase
MTMEMTRKGAVSKKQHEMSPEEWKVRVDLAACYRLVALYEMTDLDATHISARDPHNPKQFFLNPYGLLFDEITATSLVKCDLDGNIIDSEHSLNMAGYTIHSAVLAARPDAGCVIHTHTRAGMAVSAQQDGLLPITQTALRFYRNLSYHDYEGIAEDEDEKNRLVRDLGKTQAMILKNHGLLTCGRTVGEAWVLVHDLEKACQSQIDAQSGGVELSIPSKDVCERTADQYQAYSGGNRIPGERAWPAHLRKLDRIDASYRS